MYYDHHGNVIQTHEQNLLGGYEHYYYRLSFTGKPLKVKHEHTTADTINVEILRYTYDNMERLSNTYESHGGRGVLPRRRDYCGNHIYRNGVLERVLNDVPSKGRFFYVENQTNLVI